MNNRATLPLEDGYSGVKLIDNDAGRPCDQCRKTPEEIYPLITTDGVRMFVCLADLKRELRREKLKEKTRAARGELQPQPEADGPELSAALAGNGEHR